MNLLEMINGAVVVIGLPTLIGVAVSIGGKLEILKRIEKSVDSEIRPDLKEVRERFFAWEGKAQMLFKTSSPVELIENGLKALRDSGLEDYIDKHANELFDFCNANLKMNTAYDIQQSIFDYFDKIEFDVDFEKKLKDYAYKNGIGLEVMRRIGAIHFRNITLDKKKIERKEVDKKPYSE